MSGVEMSGVELSGVKLSRVEMSNPRSRRVVYVPNTSPSKLTII